MRGLSRLRRRRPTGDRGAVAVLTSLTFTAVLMGAATIVVDVGLVYVERQQLQSGADAAARAIAASCADRVCAAGEAAALGAGLAAENAEDRLARVTEVCVDWPGPKPPGVEIGDCPPAPASPDRADCVAAPAEYPTVQVRTASQSADGPFLRSVFADTLPGEDDRTVVATCARAAWGPPRAAAGLAVTFSLCEWNYYTGNGTRLWPADAGDPPAAAWEKVIYLHRVGPSGCPVHSTSGSDAPGNFGWLDAERGTCEATPTSGESFGGDTGNNATAACEDALADLRDQGRVALIPIHDEVNGRGSNAEYHVVGFASFVVTGYFVKAHPDQPSNLAPYAAHCQGSERCLYGYFTGPLLPIGGPIGGPDLGLGAVVQLVG